MFVTPAMMRFRRERHPLYSHHTVNTGSSSRLSDAVELFKAHRGKIFVASFMLAVAGTYGAIKADQEKMGECSHASTAPACRAP